MHWLTVILASAGSVAAHVSGATIDAVARIRMDLRIWIPPMIAPTPLVFPLTLKIMRSQYLK
jgi:hypothetical protein